ncbi:MAG: glycosyltransferase family 4 protein [Promethearchaeota archaeon]|jgi:glycosyltransferase involved in cell wall biosynthesis
MKIALIAFEFYPIVGGIARHLRSFCEAFRDTNHKLYVFNRSYSGNRIYNLLDTNIYRLKDIYIFLRHKILIKYLLLAIWKIIRDKTIPIYHRILILLYLFSKPEILIRNIKNLSQIYPYFKKYDFQIIISGGSGVNSLFISFILSRIFNKKVISWAHGNEFLIRSLWSLKTFIIKNLDKIILSNRNTIDLMKRIHHIKDNQILQINYGLTLRDYELKLSKEQIRRDLNISDKDFVLLSVGRHVPRKNFDLVIKSINEIKRLNPKLNIKYYMIGSGPETTKLKKLAFDLKIQEDIIFLGVCDELTRNKFYKLSDLFLMPSVKQENSIEGFGLVFLEANLYKVPVIGAFSGGISEAIEDGKTGFLVKPNSLNDLVEKIIYFYENREKRAEMGDYSFNRVIKSYNWDLIINQYIELFKILIY